MKVASSMRKWAIIPIPDQWEDVCSVCKEVSKFIVACSLEWDRSSM
jgi:hypothetical protein